MKKILIPTKNSYLKKLIQQTENFLKRLRWRVYWFESRDDEIQNQSEKESYGFKSSNTPPQHPELLAFEEGMYNMIGNIKFQNASNAFQDKMKSDIEILKADGNIVVEADKTSNL